MFLAQLSHSCTNDVSKEGEVVRNAGRWHCTGGPANLHLSFFVVDLSGGEIVEDTSMKKLLAQLDIETFVFDIKEGLALSDLEAFSKQAQSINYRIVNENTLEVDLNKSQRFISVFLTLFILSPLAYFFISVSEKDKRTDYPGKEIAAKVQKSWNMKFTSKISHVSGDEWAAGNLSYHLKSRPQWIGTSEKINFKDKLSIVEVYENNISEAVSKIGYFKVYGK